LERKTYQLKKNIFLNIRLSFFKVGSAPLGKIFFDKGDNYPGV
jgi:hypothetical protein